MRFPFLKEAISSLFKKPSTLRYPIEKKEAPEGYRGRIVFHPDKCINCGMCIRVCAPGSITRTVEKVDEGDKVTMEFYMGSCTFCQTCADFCPKKAIELTKDYSMIAENEEDLKTRGTFIKKLPPKPATAPAPAKPAAAPAPAQPAAAPENTAAPSAPPATPTPSTAEEKKEE